MSEKISNKLMAAIAAAAAGVGAGIIFLGRKKEEPPEEGVQITGISYS